MSSGVHAEATGHPIQPVILHTSLSGSDLSIYLQQKYKVKCKYDFNYILRNTCTILIFNDQFK